MQRAAELLFAAEWINAERALELGLFTHLLPADALVEGALELATKFSERPLPALRAAKRLLLHGRRQDIEAAYAREMDAARQMMSESASEHQS